MACASPAYSMWEAKRSLLHWGAACWSCTVIHGGKRLEHAPVDIQTTKMQDAARSPGSGCHDHWPPSPASPAEQQHRRSDEWV